MGHSVIPWPIDSKNRSRISYAAVCRSQMTATKKVELPEINSLSFHWNLIRKNLKRRFDSLTLSERALWLTIFDLASPFFSVEDESASNILNRHVKPELGKRWFIKSWKCIRIYFQSRILLQRFYLKRQEEIYSQNSPSRNLPWCYFQHRK